MSTYIGAGSVLDWNGQFVQLKTSNGHVLTGRVNCSSVKLYVLMLTTFRLITKLWLDTEEYKDKYVSI